MADIFVKIKNMRLLGMIVPPFIIRFRKLMNPEPENW